MVCISGGKEHCAVFGRHCTLPGRKCHFPVFNAKVESWTGTTVCDFIFHCPTVQQYSEMLWDPGNPKYSRPEPDKI